MIRVVKHLKRMQQQLDTLQAAVVVALENLNPRLIALEEEKKKGNQLKGLETPCGKE